MSTKQIQRKEIVIHDFDKGLDHTLKAIEKLSIRNSELIKLDDSYNILCGVRLGLPYYMTYNGRKNLK